MSSAFNVSDLAKCYIRRIKIKKQDLVTSNGSYDTSGALWAKFSPCINCSINQGIICKGTVWMAACAISAVDFFIFFIFVTRHTRPEGHLKVRATIILFQRPLPPTPRAETGLPLLQSIQM